MARSTNPVTLRRSTDPLPSALAAEENVGTGRNRSQKETVLAKVKLLPGCTSSELAKAIGGSAGFVAWRYIVARRLSELEREGLLHRAPSRKCNVSGRVATTWHPGMALSRADDLLGDRSPEPGRPPTTQELLVVRDYLEERMQVNMEGWSYRRIEATGAVLAWFARLLDETRPR